MIKKRKAKKILIMGLPGAGKTFLAREIYKDLSAVWINGDVIRKKVVAEDPDLPGETLELPGGETIQVDLKGLD